MQQKCKSLQLLWKIIDIFNSSKTVKIELPDYLAIPLLDLYSKEINSRSWRCRSVVESQKAKGPGFDPQYRKNNLKLHMISVCIVRYNQLILKFSIKIKINKISMFKWMLQRCCYNEGTEIVGLAISSFSKSPGGADITGIQVVESKLISRPR